MTDQSDYQNSVDMYADKSRNARTDMDCHQCRGNFIAVLDRTLEGQHKIECPHCGHEHFRKVKNGKVTEERWGSFDGDKRNAHRPRHVWKSDSLPIQTSGASSFIRERWLQTFGRGLVDDD